MALLAKDIDRFWSRVNFGGSPDVCWEWDKPTKVGYGQINIQHHITYTHRLAWIIANGEIPDGLWVLHKCDNRRCVNPNHLFLGDVTANNLDMRNKGRGSKPPMHCGESQHASKLTESDIRNIRAAYIPWVVSTTALAEKYNVSQGVIWGIVNRRSWQHVS